jgi:hypothetical protein
MRTKALHVIGVVTITALLSGSVDAQKGKPPQGQPFQVLRDAISQTTQTLVQQIESLQAQLDANTANDKIQSQLIAATQTLVSQLEGGLSDTQATLSELAAYNALQQQLLQQQIAQVSALQAQAMNDQSRLFQLYQAQQAALATLTTQVDFLTLQTQAQQADLAALNARLTSLKHEYDQTSARLASGCPANSSIRQLTTTTVICEADNSGTGILQGAEFVGPGVTAAPGATVAADVFCAASSPAYISSGGGMSATLPLTIVQSVKLLTNGWRVIVQNPNAFNVVVQARVSCVRVN